MVVYLDHGYAIIVPPTKNNPLVQNFEHRLMMHNFICISFYKFPYISKISVVLNFHDLVYFLGFIVYS